ncbi:MAG: hypothetical protein WC457_01520 [Patescibacteria group bacterium]
MSEKMREMVAYHQLAAKKAEADEKIDRAGAWPKPVLNKFISVLGVIFLLALIAFGIHYIFSNIITKWILLSFSVVLGISLLFPFGVSFASSVQIIRAKDLIFKWWENEHHTSFAELQELFEQLRTTAPGSDERVGLTYTHMTRLATRKALHEIVDSLRENFSDKIPDEEVFYQRVQELMRQSDDEDDAETSLEAPRSLAGGDYPAPFSS